MSRTRQKSETDTSEGGALLVTTPLCCSRCDSAPARCTERNQPSGNATAHLLHRCIVGRHPGKVQVGSMKLHPLPERKWMLYTLGTQCKIPTERWCTYTADAALNPRCRGLCFSTQTPSGKSRGERKSPFWWNSCLLMQECVLLRGEE